MWHHPDTSVEPTPTFASDAEMALAEQLRHQLEERYLGQSAAPASPQDLKAPPIRSIKNAPSTTY
jgi:hypothetical protein